MHISRVFVLLSVASLASVVFGAPLAVTSDDEDSLVARESEYVGDLSLRALNQKEIGQKAGEILKKQQTRKATKTERHRVEKNKRYAEKQKKEADKRKATAKAKKKKADALGSQKPKKPKKRTPAEIKAEKFARNPQKGKRKADWEAKAAQAAKKRNTAKRKGKPINPAKAQRRAANKAKGVERGASGVHGARKARVAARKAQADARKAALNRARKSLNKYKPAGLSRAEFREAVRGTVPHQGPRPMSADRAAVSQHIKNSAQKMQAMSGIPDRKKVFQSSMNKSERPTGKDVRTAVMNSHLHSAEPVGPNTPTVKPFPKHFGNFPNKGKPNAQPFPGQPSGGKSGMSEYPVTSNGAGWPVNPDKGAVRVITDNRNNVFHGVVTHPKVGSANENDYHKMT